jgi:hypothetical protein
MIENNEISIKENIAPTLTTLTSEIKIERLEKLVEELREKNTTLEMKLEILSEDSYSMKDVLKAINSGKPLIYCEKYQLENIKIQDYIKKYGYEKTEKVLLLIAKENEGKY